MDLEAMLQSDQLSSKVASSPFYWASAAWQPSPCPSLPGCFQSFREFKFTLHFVLVLWCEHRHKVKLYSWKLCVVWAQRLGVPLSEFRSRPRVLESIKRTKLIYRRSGKAGHPLEFQVMAWGAVISCCRADILNVWTPLRTTEIEHWKGHRVNRSAELCAKPHVTAKLIWL